MRICKGSAALHPESCNWHTCTWLERAKLRGSRLPGPINYTLCICCIPPGFSQVQLIAVNFDLQQVAVFVSSRPAWPGRTFYVLFSRAGCAPDRRHRAAHWPACISRQRGCLQPATISAGYWPHSQWNRQEPARRFPWHQQRKNPPEVPLSVRRQAIAQ